MIGELRINSCLPLPSLYMYNTNKSKHIKHVKGVGILYNKIAVNMLH